MRETAMAPAEPAAGQAEIQTMLDRMARAVTRGDGKTVASLWAVPALVLGDEEARAVTTVEEVQAFFDGAKEQYNAKGIVDTRAEIQELSWLTQRLALVRVRWPYLNERGDEVGAETSTYALRRENDGMLKVHAALMHGVNGEFSR